MWFGIYLEKKESGKNTVKEHAERAGVPANEITLISSVLKNNASNG